MTIDMKETISPYFLALRPVLIQIGETFGPDCLDPNGSVR